MAPTAPVAKAMTARRPRVVAWGRLGDEALARKAAAGSPAAFAALYERYHGPLLGYCRSILLDVDDAGDAAQTAMESALRALPDRDPGRPLRPWLYRIAHNAAIDIVRKRPPHVALGSLTEPAVDGPEVDADRRTRLTQLFADLRTLPPRQRGALVMRELSGLDYEEIGGALGLSPAAARRAVFDARSALHDCADGRAAECTAIRRSLSDGDRRRLRARRVRAHLRSCNGCASFQRAIVARRADLLVVAPWLTGAAAASAMGLGAGAATGGALLGGGAATAGGGSLAAAAGGGFGWAGLPAAAKGLAVAAAVATSGTAAVQTERAATGHDRPAPRARSATAVRAAPPLPVADRRDRSTVVRRGARRAAAADALRTSPARLLAGGVAGTLAARRRSASLRAVRELDSVPRPAVAPPRGAVRIIDERTAAAVPAPSSATEPIRRRLDAARRRILEALELARRTATHKGAGGLESARSTLDRTLAGIRATLERVLAAVRLKLPEASTPAHESTGSQSLSGLLRPARLVLDAVQSLLRGLLAPR